jgi:hypothetical protein
MTTQRALTVNDPWPPNVPSYREFRMVAEWASAIRGDPLYFAYEGATGRMRLAQVSGREPPLFTPPNARRPVMTEVEFAVGGAEPLKLDGHGSSALFWSESAVEKFLFPSFASASGDHAGRVLSRLYDAWYGYPGRVVQVCALAYRYGTDAAAGELSLEACLGLVCLERSTRTLKLMPLDEFERTYPTDGPRAMSTIPAVPGRAEPRTGWKVDRVGSIVAREAAEFVSGLRGHYVWFTLDDGELTPWICPTAAPGDSPPGTVIAHGVTLPLRPDRPAPTSVAVYLDGGDVAHPVVSPSDDPTRAPDSIFWTDGSVERLLLPYYASVKGRSAPLFTAILMGKWDNSIDVDCPGLECAVEAVRQSLPGAGRAADDDYSPVYAVTHLPRSEYVSDGGPALENRTALLTFDGEAGVARMHPLLGGTTPRAGAAPRGGHRVSEAADAGPAKRSRKRTSRAR